MTAFAIVNARPGRVRSSAASPFDTLDNANKAFENTTSVPDGTAVSSLPTNNSQSEPPTSFFTITTTSLASVSTSLAVSSSFTPSTIDSFSYGTPEGVASTTSIDPIMTSVSGSNVADSVATLSEGAVNPTFTTISSTASVYVTKKAVASATSSFPFPPSSSSPSILTTSNSMLTDAASSSTSTAHSSTSSFPTSSPASLVDTPTSSSSVPSSKTKSSSTTVISTAKASSTWSTIVATQNNQPPIITSSVSTSKSTSSSIAATQHGQFPTISSGSQISTVPASRAVDSQSTQPNTFTSLDVPSEMITVSGERPSPKASSSGVNSVHFGNGIAGITSVSSTVQVVSTLSTPEAVTVSSAGSSFVTTPAFITSIFVSTGTNGIAAETFTSIFANPTTSMANSMIDRTFWNNRGAVAGVFVAVALVVLASVCSIVYCCHRRRRRLEIILPDEFRPQDMSEQPTTYQAVRNSVGFKSASDDPQRRLMESSITSGLTGLTTEPDNATPDPHSNSQTSHQLDTGILGLTGMLVNKQIYEGAFSHYHRFIPMSGSRHGVLSKAPFGVAFSTEPKPDYKSAPAPLVTDKDRPPSPAPSSPSIYPPSLSPVPEKDEDNYLFYERETQHKLSMQLPALPPSTLLNEVDCRNPFASPSDAVKNATAEQRAVYPPRIQMGKGYRPLTPPDSSPGHSAPVVPQSSESEETNKPANPFSNSFLGRSVSVKIEPLPRPKRNPLRLLTSESLLKG